MFGGDQRLVDEGRTRIRDGGYFVLGTILAMEVPTDKGRYIRKCVQSEVRLRRGELEVSMSGTIACYGGAHIKFFGCSRMPAGQPSKGDNCWGGRVSRGMLYQARTREAFFIGRKECIH